ncbi:MAG: precorrin-2 C(20)-methyltransferase [Kiloniellales bacterium]|nr:precorrin-2 C(20)-methyltransferase [Kiloniellales bacterium]
MTAKLYGLGIGPGDPDLITLKALKILKRVPVIAYPAPDKGDSLARKIVEAHLPPPGQQIEIAVRMPMVVSRFPAKEVYDWAEEEFKRHLAAGRDLAFLCEGDPFFYGSFMYLFGRLAERHPVEVVPGVSSLTACAAMLGAPLAARNDVLTVIPAPLERNLLIRKLEDAEAAAIIKVGRHFEKVREVLQELGLASQARYVEHATMESQKILPLEQVEPGEAPYFSMILLHRRGTAWS